MKKLLILLTTLTFIVIGANPAIAHSQLVTSNPASGARLNVLPSSATLTFNEGVTLDKGALQLINSEGKILASNKTILKSNSLSIAIPKKLVSGLYGLRYSVSSADGHRVIGLLPFAYNYQESDKLLIVSKEIKSKNNVLNLNCKCKKGLSQISVDAKGKKVIVTLTNKKTKAPLALELTYSGALFVANQLLISDGAYQVDVDVYIDDFNIETYSGKFNF